MNETVGLSVVCSLGYTIHAKLISRQLSGAFFSQVPITLRLKNVLYSDQDLKNKEAVLSCENSPFVFFIDKFILSFTKLSKPRSLT